jgi:DNA-binding CsgD family transcriptional regulator
VPAAFGHSPLGAFGINEVAERFYRLILRYSGDSLEVLSDRVGMPLAEVRQHISPLVDARLVRVDDGTVSAEPPEFALGRLLNDATRRLEQAEDSLTTARHAMTDYLDSYLAGQRTEWQPVTIEVVPAPDLLDVMHTLVQNTSGELLFLRPDQWMIPTGKRMDLVVQEALRNGRESRVLYPAAVMESSPESVRDRAALGEQVRLLPSIPCRLAVFGEQVAILPETWGSAPGHRLLIRQPALVAALRSLFDSMWSRGVTVPGLEATDASDVGQQLLEMLASGAKDEQIARALGMSLRTVRRRIASLMAELGADSRFQAGIEAVRRGWL